MDKREALRSMLNNIINDKPEQASLDLHTYLTQKMRDVAGLAPAEVPAEVVEPAVEQGAEAPATAGETPATE
jgi:hypothetical protein